MENTAQNTTYPTVLNEEGFFFENADDHELGIHTKIYPNKSKVKQTKISTGINACVRSLKAKDSSEMTRLMDKDKDRYLMAMITVATTFDGTKLPIEDVENLSMKDYQLLMGMCSELNF